MNKANEIFNIIQSARVEAEILRGNKIKCNIDDDLIKISEALTKELINLKTADYNK